MAKKRVQVFDRNGEYVADPPLAELSSADTFKIMNNTDEDLVWVVSDSTLFQGGAIAEVVQARKFSNVKNPTNAANFSGFASYQLIGTKSGKKAKGNSDPVIIVEN